MASDELGTLHILKAHRKQFIDPTIAAHEGNIVKATGDGLLVSFGSAVDAVSCAVAIQRGMIHRNLELLEEKRFLLQIGINVGDIILDENDIFGEGVDIAARLETLSEPGGVCISYTVRDQNGEKLPLAFVDLGEKTVKNIPKPVHVFGLSSQSIADGQEIPTSRTPTPARPWGRYAIAALAISILLAFAVGWLYHSAEESAGDVKHCDDRCYGAACVHCGVAASVPLRARAERLFCRWSDGRYYFSPRALFRYLRAFSQLGFCIQRQIATAGGSREGTKRSLHHRRKHSPKPRAYSRCNSSYRSFKRNRPLVGELRRSA